jgi:hypothetical protein
MEQRMPLARYFSFVGGVLLALLLVLDAYLPEVPVADSVRSNLPVIRIHSERKWPERVVYDTSQPPIIPAQMASGETKIPGPAVADVSVKAREREAFAQMQPSNAKQRQPSNPKKREPRAQHQAKIARRYTAPQSFLAARQAQFGWFGNSIW